MFDLLGKLANFNIFVISEVEAPSNTGVAIGTPLEIFSINSNISLCLILKLTYHNNVFHKFL